MIKAALKICSAFLLPIWLLCFPIIGNAQEIIEGLETDTIVVFTPDSLTQATLVKADSAFVPLPEVPVSAFKPNPTKAILLAFIPGMGQVYNRKYWKLPIVYGGFMACMYAITWNNKNYQDYTGIYKSMVFDADRYRKVLETEDEEAIADFELTPNSPWVEYFGSEERAMQNITNTNYQNQFKSRKDYFRRYRDLSIIIMAGVYFITLVDAYVDAQLFDFDISPDLSMRVEPVVSPQTRYSSRSIGFSCSLTF